MDCWPFRMLHSSKYRWCEENFIVQPCVRSWPEFKRGVALTWVSSPQPLPGLIRGITNRGLTCPYNVLETSIHTHRLSSCLLAVSSGHSGLVSHTGDTFDGYLTHSRSLRMPLQPRGGLKGLSLGISARACTKTRGA